MNPIHKTHQNVTRLVLPDTSLPLPASRVTTGAYIGAAT